MPLSDYSLEILTLLVGIPIMLWSVMILVKFKRKRAGKKADKQFKIKELKEAHKKEELPEKKEEVDNLKIEEHDHSKSKEELRLKAEPTVLTSLPL